ncbi:hypothetical protein PG995_014459 [Apiospora arundinis]
MSQSGSKGQQVAKLRRLAVHSSRAATRRHLLLSKQRLNDGQVTRNDSAAEKILRFDMGDAFGVFLIVIPVTFVVLIYHPVVLIVVVVF